MNKNKKTKDEIFELTIMKNVKRKSVFIDKVQIIGGVPLFSWLDINITELCNRKCEFCPRKDPIQYPSQNLNMDVRLAKKIADELKSYNYTGGIIFSGYGEPLMHDNAVDLVKTFGKDIHVELATNGDKLTEDMACRLFDAGLSVLMVSMYDGPYQVEYYKKMFSKIGIREGQYVLRDRWYSVEEDYGLKLTNRAGSVKNGNQAAIIIDKPCYYMHYSMQIDWNGDIMLCIQDFNKKIKSGNLYSQSLLDIWKSRNIAKYRKILGRGYRALYPCSSCNVNGTLHGLNHAELWNEIYGGEK